MILTSINVWTSRRIPFVLRMILFGACVAAATYVRPTAWPLLFIFPGLQWLLDRQWRALFVGGGLAILTASVLFAPWTYRSIVLFDRFVFVSANGGVNLWMGNNPDSTGGYMDLPSRPFATEVDRDHFYGREAVHFIVSHPLEYLKLSAKRTITTFNRETIGIVWNEKGLQTYGGSLATTLKAISTVYWWVMLASGAFGLALIIRRRPAQHMWPLLASFGYLSVFPILTVAMDRYHVPIDPMLAIFAAYGLSFIRDYRQKYKTPNPNSTPTPAIATERDSALTENM